MEGDTIPAKPWGMASKLLFSYVALSIRLAYIYLGALIDESTIPLKYTSTDQEMCNAAANLILQGKSPFHHEMYKYQSPIGAYICTANIVLHPQAMKFIACLLDIIAGLIMWSIIDSQNSQAHRKRDTYLYITVWLYNPLTLLMSTSGTSLDLALLLLLQLLTIWSIIHSRYITAGFIFGLAIHVNFKFSIVNMFVFYVFIDAQVVEEAEDGAIAWRYQWYELTFNRLLFVVLMFASFLGITGLFYKINKYDYVAQTIFLGNFGMDEPLAPSLYNFSIFYLTSLHHGLPYLINIVQLYSVVMLVIFAGQSFYQDLLFTILIQSWCQIAFSQELYPQHMLIWLVYAIMVAANNGIFSDDLPIDEEGEKPNTIQQTKSMKPLYACMALFTMLIGFPMPLHCALAYASESLGRDTYRLVNACNYCYFGANVFGIWLTIRNHELNQTTVKLRNKIKCKQD